MWVGYTQTVIRDWAWQVVRLTEQGQPLPEEPPIFETEGWALWYATRQPRARVEARALTGDGGVGSSPDTSHPVKYVTRMSLPSRLLWVGPRIVRDWIDSWSSFRRDV